MVVNEFWSTNLAWKISFPVAFILVFYMFFQYQRMFLWHGLLATIYFIVGIVPTIAPESSLLSAYGDKLVFALFLSLVLFQNGSLTKLAGKVLPHKLPMRNNENELRKTSRDTLVIITVYLILSISIWLITGSNTTIFSYIVKWMFVISLVVFALYQTANVDYIRKRLAGEDWLPIVDTNGVVTGTVQYQPDAQNLKRLMHPVVRLYFLEENKILLQQRSPDDRSEPLGWDASVSRKVRINQLVEDTLLSRVEELYKIKPKHSMFLTNYKYKGGFCDNYIYLFVSCHSENIQPQMNRMHAVKWWTLQQIEANLGEGVFTERFEREFEILKRSGLLEGESFCDCDCVLRDTVRSMAIRKMN